MPDIQTAIVSAGLAPMKTLRERVWLIIKDKGPLTIKSVASRMGLPTAKVASNVYNAAARGVIRSVGSGREKRYEAVGDTYEDALTYHSKAPASARAPGPALVVRPATNGGAAPDPSSIPSVIHNLTLRELMELYLYLYKLFK